MKGLLEGLPDINPEGSATAIIAHLGGLAPALAAPRSRQLRAAGGNAGIVKQLRLARELLLCALREPAHDRPLLSNWARMLDYLRFDQGYEAHEQARVLFLNSKHYLVHEQRTPGSIDEATVYIRDILRTSLEVGAAGVILVHNHPSGVAEPSRCDVSLTERLAAAARLLDIRLHDHIIVSRAGYYSFREQGLL